MIQGNFPLLPTMGILGMNTLFPFPPSCVGQRRGYSGPSLDGQLLAPGYDQAILQSSWSSSFTSAVNASKLRSHSTISSLNLYGNSTLHNGDPALQNDKPTLQNGDRLTRVLSRMESTTAGDKVILDGRSKINHVYLKVLPVTN